MGGLSGKIWAGGLVFALLTGWPGGPARAEVNLRTQWTDEMSSSTLTDKASGTKTSTESNRVDQLYNLDAVSHLYPNLAFRIGGVFQLNDERNTSEGVTTESGNELLHPFVDLNLSTPIYTTGLGYEQTESRQTATGREPTVARQDQLNGRFLWQPVDFPRCNLNYSRTHRYDDSGTTDQEQEDLALGLRYSWREISTNYSYVRGTATNLISGLKSVRDVHDGRISGSYELGKGLSVNGSYRASYATEVWEGSGLPFLAPLQGQASKGFYLLDDLNPSSWVDITTTDAPFLADGIKSGSSSINLGLNGDETKNVSFGLDFGFAARLSTVRVWVDRDAGEVANALVWTLYTSDDERTWTPRALTHPVAYVGGIDNYFEFTLADSVAAAITARFIKVVTTPLANGQDLLGHFPDLFVTEVEVFSLEIGDITRRSFDNSANLGVMWQIDPRTTMGYSVFYRAQQTDSEELRQRNLATTQTVNVNRVFNGIFNGSIRGSRDEYQTPTQEVLGYSYGAVLAAGWLNTFRQSLSYGGANTATIHTSGAIDGTRAIDSSNSLLLRNVAQLYRGWSANVDFGYSWSSPWEAGKRDTEMFRLETSIIPNPKLTVNGAYSYSSTSSDAPSSREQRGELSAAFSPTSAISLFTRFLVLDQGDTPKVFQDYSLNWAPFPDGVVQVFLSYNENLTNDGDDSKTSQVGFDWRINNRVDWRNSYSTVKSESLTTITDSRVFTTSLRISL